MDVQHTCRIPKSTDDAIKKIIIGKNVSKNKAINEILQLGLEAYFNKNETADAEKNEKNLAPMFSEIEKKLETFLIYMKDLDLKSFRMNVFLTDFVKDFYQDEEKFMMFHNAVLDQMDAYKKRIKLNPKLGFIVLKYMKDISNRNIPNQFYDEIEAAYLAMLEEK